jgi:hypothetical protein
MTPSTQQMIQQAGAVAVAVSLLLALTVVLLRLAALPLAVAATALDKGAELAARPLTAPDPDDAGRRHWR